MTGAEFSFHRKLLGYSQAGLARRLGLHPITIARYEKAEKVPEIAEYAILGLWQPQAPPEPLPAVKAR